MAKSLLTTGHGDGGQGVGQGLTRYSCVGNGALDYNATEANKQITFQSAGVLSNLYVEIPSNGVTATSTIRTRVNGANGAQSVSITSGATGEFEDATNTDTIAAGDEVNYQLVAGGSGTTIFTGVISTVFAATTNTVGIMVTGRSANVATDSVTRFVPITSTGDSTATEANTQYQFSNGGTLENMFVYVSANTRTTDTTFRSRINGGNGNQLVTYGSGVTGILEDTSNTDTVAAGDLVNTSWTTGGSGGTLTHQVIKYEMTTTDSSFNMGVVAEGVYMIGTGTAYIPIGDNAAGFGGAGNTETHVRTDANFDFTASKLWIRVTQFTTALLVDLRVNQGSSALTVSASGTGEFEDTTHTVALVATDEINYRFTSTGNSTITGISMVGTQTAAGPANLKTYNTNLKANIKSIDTNLLANVKTLNTNA